MHHVQILSLIEEAAGTRMYESKRSSAQKTIEKKDNKLKEIEAVCMKLKHIIQNTPSVKLKCGHP